MNSRRSFLQITMLLTFQIFERTKNHGKMFLKLGQTSFGGIVHWRRPHCYTSNAHSEDELITIVKDRLRKLNALGKP